jgi:hypothetical protein
MSIRTAADGVIYFVSGTNGRVDRPRQLQRNKRNNTNCFSGRNPFGIFPQQQSNQVRHERYDNYNSVKNKIY